MSARTLAAAAVMTAAFAGSATAQVPPSPLPLGGGAGPASPYYGGMPAGPAVSPMHPGYPPGPMAAPGGAPCLPPDALDGLNEARGPKSWIGAEYLIYWTKNMPISSAVATGGPAAGFGTLGAAGTVTLIGNEDISFSEQHGLRVHGGCWINDVWAIEGSVFLLPSKDKNIGGVGPTDLLPTLARPFSDTNIRGQNVRLLNRPGAFTGGISAEAQTGLWGAEIGPVLRAIERGPVTIDGMLGFKHVSLEESLEINDFARAGVQGVANFNGVAYRNGATTFVQDYFSTTNRIYAVMLGSRANLHMDAFTFSLTSKVSLGTNVQTVSADGSTTLTGPFVAPTKVGGGLLAAGPNVGKFSRSEFVYVPELNLNLTCQLTPHLTLSFGYNVLFISNVVRPGDQLGSPINPVFIPTSSSFGGRFGPTEPTPQFSTSSFWANGLNLGLTVGF